MTEKPVTVSTMDRVGKAIRLLQEHDVRHLPVVDGERLVGMVSDRDVQRHQPPTDEDTPLGYTIELLERPVHSVMNEEPVVVDRTASIADAVDALLCYKIGAVCVVDEGGRLVGIVSYIDLLAALHPRRRG